MEEDESKNAKKSTRKRNKPISKKTKKVHKAQKLDETDSGDTIKSSIPIHDLNDLPRATGFARAVTQPPNSVYYGAGSIFDLNKNSQGYISPYSSPDRWANVLPDNYAYASIPIGSDFLSFPRVNSSSDQQITLQEEIIKLKKEFNDNLKELELLENENKDKSEAIDRLKEKQEQLIAKEKVNHILPRICEEARKKLFESDDFKSLFADSTQCNAVVVSIDIRKSTELMLKARTPDLFARFITELSQKLSDAIIRNYGIFDKFTGDGILAFFPDFYSGSNSIYYALSAAKQCHEAFNYHYYNSRECFNVFLKNIGLGIGIDYGYVTLVNRNNELTVVGIPVVYACRLSGADAGVTLINQHAKEHLESLYKDQIEIVESDINIKNEGTAIAYSIKINEKAVKVDKPDWDSLIQEFKK
jgi:class 3 adenylate cyclase